MSITSHSATGDSDNGNLSLSIPQGGGLVAGRHTVKVVTNSVSGATLDLYTTGSTNLTSTDNQNLTIPSIGSNSNYYFYEGVTSPLSDGYWGVAIPGSAYANQFGNIYNGADVYEQYVTNPGPIRDTGPYPGISPKFAGIIRTNQNGQGSDVDTTIEMWSEAGAYIQNIYYGVMIDDPASFPAGDYSTSVVYTATVELPSRPTITSVSPNTYKLGSGEPNTITISATSGLASTYNVWIDLNSNNTYDANEQCTNLNVASDTTLTCNIPTDESITTDTPYTIYVQTQASAPTPITNAFTYTKQTGITTITDGTVAVDIDDGMIPVIYNDSTSNWESLTTAEAKTSGTWYDYGAKKWANAVTVKDPDTYKNQHKTVSSSDILGYWVYIPRYAYKVMRYSVNDKYVSDSVATSNGGFEIVFEAKDTPKKIPAACSNSNSNQYYQDCSNVSQDYGATTGTAWATHPAFTWGTEELNGFWIGKFETTGSTSQPTVLPNQKHISAYNRGNIGGYYDIAKSMGVEDSNNKYGNTASTNQSNQNNNNLAISTSHMLKNSEWGAVAYLSASKYGAGVNNVQINSQYESGTDGNGDSSYGITGYGPNGSSQYNTENGQLASTTNNIYGVYDMAGGAYEYVMGSYTNDSTQSYPSNGYITNKVKPPYVDLYPDSIFTNNDVYTNNNQCTWATCGGHALYETKNVQSVSRYDESWGGASSNFVESSYPWFIRGGSVYDGSDAGVFDSTRSSGGTRNILGNGFRVALLSLLTN